MIQTILLWCPPPCFGGASLNSTAKGNQPWQCHERGLVGGGLPRGTLKTGSSFIHHFFIFLSELVKWSTAQWQTTEIVCDSCRTIQHYGVTLIFLLHQQVITNFSCNRRWWYMKTLSKLYALYMFNSFSTFSSYLWPKGLKLGPLTLKMFTKVVMGIFKLVFHIFLTI